MRAAVIGPAFGLEHLHIVDREDPGEPHGDQVRVRITHASINFRDLLMIQGLYNPRQPLPLIPGSDGAGVVEAVGPEATRFKVGDRVVAGFFRDWIAGKPSTAELRSSLGGPLDGTWREVLCAPQHAFVPTPQHLSDAEAATLPCAALTAWSALVTQGNLKAGESVLVLGTGGVSMFAIAFAQMFGAQVIATTRSDAKANTLRERFGVPDVINTTTTPEWGRAVRDLTGGVDHIIEVGGAGTLTRSIQAVRPGGIIHLIGVLAGGASHVDLVPVLMRNVRIQGVVVGPRQEFEAMNRAIAVNELHPVVDREFALDDIGEALEHLRDQKHIGKIVIRI